MKTQSGRSMIEMLGVLAIIGVLSVGGLMGYNRAMRSNRANGAIYYVGTCMTLQRSRGNGIDADGPNNCLALTGEAAVPGGLAADPACRRYANGRTQCGVQVQANLIDDVALKLGFAAGGAANFCLDSAVGANNGWTQAACVPPAP